MQVLDKNSNEVRIGDTIEFKSWEGGLTTPVLKRGLVISMNLYQYWEHKEKWIVKLSVKADRSNFTSSWNRSYVATISNLNNVRVINF